MVHGKLWSEEEDLYLKDKGGKGGWSYKRIAEGLDGRTSKQCKDRFYRLGKLQAGPSAVKTREEKDAHNEKFRESNRVKYEDGRGALSQDERDAVNETRREQWADRGDEEKTRNSASKNKRQNKSYAVKSLARLLENLEFLRENPDILLEKKYTAG